uniref:2,4-dienoyl-CoA reductase [(3E)-enoyl-CoA-producing] n=4 Tax=Lotharella globosa TaxID=91324 RepID=A0A7S3Z5B8_9EUKA
MMGRRVHKLEEACSALKAMDAKVQALPVQGDVRDPSKLDKAINVVMSTYGQIDVLVNCAAGNFMCAAEDLLSKGFETVVGIDLQGTFNVSRACLPALKKSKRGLIINISATLQYKAAPFQIHAAAAKAGIDVVTQTLGVEWGSEYGIRCVGIAPGPIAGTTGGPTGRVFGNFLKGQDVKDIVPIGRWGETDDIGLTALFLATPAGSYINATTIVVDGGQWHDASRMYRMASPFLKAIAKQRQA